LSPSGSISLDVARDTPGGDPFREEVEPLREPADALLDDARRVGQSEGPVQLGDQRPWVIGRVAEHGLWVDGEVRSATCGEQVTRIEVTMHHNLPVRRTGEPAEQLDAQGEDAWVGPERT
jgi:hypothetical protein